MLRLSEGDLDSEIPYLQQRAEIGEMARAVNIFKQRSLEAEQLRKERENESEERQEAIRQEMLGLAGALEEALETSVKAIADKTDQMRDHAQRMGDTANDVSSQAITVASASEEASASVATVATAADDYVVPRVPTADREVRGNLAYFHNFFTGITGVADNAWDLVMGAGGIVLEFVGRTGLLVSDVAGIVDGLIDPLHRKAPVAGFQIEVVGGVPQAEPVVEAPAAILADDEFRLPVVGLPDDLDVGLSVENHGETGSDKVLVVGNEDADGHALPPSLGTTASTIQPRSGWGPAVNVPPSRRVRSAIPARPKPAASSIGVGVSPSSRRWAAWP